MANKDLENYKVKVIDSELSPFYPEKYPEIIALYTKENGWIENDCFFNPRSGHVRYLEYTYTYTNYHDESDSEISIYSIKNLEKIKFTDENTKKQFEEIQQYREESMLFAKQILCDYLPLSYASLYHVRSIIEMTDREVSYSINYREYNISYVLRIKKIDMVSAEHTYPSSPNFRIYQNDYFVHKKDGLLFVELILDI